MASKKHDQLIVDALKTLAQNLGSTATTALRSSDLEDQKLFWISEAAEIQAPSGLPITSNVLGGALSDPNTVYPQPWTGNVEWTSPAASILAEWTLTFKRSGSISGTAIAQSVFVIFTVDGTPEATTLVPLEPPADGFARSYHLAAHLNLTEGQTVSVSWGFGGAQAAATLTPLASCLAIRRRL